MSNFMFALQKELAKLLQKKKYIVLLIMGTLFTAVRWGGSALVTRLSGGIVSIKANIIMEMLPFVFEVLAPIIIIIAVSDLFTHEYSKDTLKACLLQPVTRFKLLTAKAAAVILLAAGSVILMYIVNLIIQVLSGGSTAQAPITFLAYLIDILPLVGIVFLGIFINTILKGATSATLLTLGVYALMKYAGLYVSGSAAYLFTATAKLHLLLLGQTMPLRILLEKFGILFGSILILYSLSYIIFDRKSV